jgi:hypothetical protein
MQVLTVSRIDLVKRQEVFTTVATLVAETKAECYDALRIWFSTKRHRATLYLGADMGVYPKFDIQIKKSAEVIMFQRPDTY